MTSRLVPWALALLAAAAPAAAQDAPAAPAPAPAPAPAAPTALSYSRASWLSDRLPLRVGDLITIVIDEQSAARERTSKDATADRALAGGINPGLDSATRIGPSKGISLGLKGNSRARGELTRSGDLAATLTVSVTEIASNGVVSIEGGKSVLVDGRPQEVRLSGQVRPEDITPNNTVASSRIANATISYKGKKIGPTTGIIGRLVGLLWP